MTLIAQFPYKAPVTTPGLSLAIVVHDFSGTGVVRNSIRIANRMALSGSRTELWVIRDQGAFREDISDAVRIRRIEPPCGSPIRRLETLFAVNSLARMIRDHQPAVLLSSGNHLHIATGCAYRRAGRPTTTRFIGRASNAPPRIAGRIPILGRMVNAIDAFKYRDMDTIVAVSEELAGELHGRLGIDRRKIATIPNGVDIGNIRARAAEPLDDPWFAPGAPPVIMGAGRLVRQKNFPLLIEAFAVLRSRRPARLVILGEGSSTARGRLLALTRRLAVAGDVRLQGFEPNPMRFMSRAALFILTSRWEGASNVLLEAMACGCPVVAVDCPTGVKEQLAGGRIGPIVSPLDPPTLAAAMAQRLDLPRNAADLRRHAASFNQDTMMSAYDDIIRRATDPRTNS